MFQIQSTIEETLITNGAQLTPKGYAELSGNPPNTLFTIHPLTHTHYGQNREERLLLQVYPERMLQPVQIPPEIIMRRVSPTGTEVERNVISFPVQRLWNRGTQSWSGDSREAVIPSGDLSEGTWIFHVQGVFGTDPEDRTMAWRSEEEAFELIRDK